MVSGVLDQTTHVVLRSNDSRLNLLRASEDALDHLESVCEPATFGVAQRNVLDTTYRKAGKLDRDHFAINLDVERSGVLDAVRTALFIGKGQGRAVRATLYKLNVYGRLSSLCLQVAS